MKTLPELGHEADSIFVKAEMIYYYDGAYADSGTARNQLHSFADLIRADEREACAKVCEPQEEHDDPLTAWKIAAAIRARGDK